MRTATFSLVLSIMILILSLFQFDRFQKINHATQGNNKHLEAELKTKLDHFETELSTFKKQEEALLRQTQGATLQLEEAKSLVSLADVRLRIARDLPGSIALLTLASEKIQTISDSTLIPLREALTLDIKMLQTLGVPNLEELWLSVHTLMETLTPLAPRQLVRAASNNETPQTLTPTNTPRWKEALWNSLQTVKNLIKIRHSTQPIEPLLSETDNSLVKTNLRSMLEQLRFSILMQEDKIYQQALLDTEVWLTKYYDDTHPDIQKAHVVLGSLKTIRLRPEFPILTSVEPFKALR